MPRLLAATSALVLVDYQQRLMPALHEGDAAVARGLWLAAVAREIGVPVLGTEQNPDGLGPNLPAVRAACQRTLAKRHFDAAADGLAGALRDLPAAPTQVVVAGCEAHVCLMQTALGLHDAGFEVFVAADACASRRPGDRKLGLQRLGAAGCTMGSVEMLAFEWLQASDHPRFKALLPLLRQGPMLPAGGAVPT
ncbi:MAG: isochorismatase family protein [Aquabacterium sp.]